MYLTICWSLILDLLTMFFLCLCRLPTVSVPRCRTWVRAAWSWYRMLGRFRVTPRIPTLAASSRTTPAVSARRSPSSSRRFSLAPAAHRLVSTPRAPSVVSSQIWTPLSCLPQLEHCVLREMTALLVTGKILLMIDVRMWSLKKFRMQLGVSQKFVLKFSLYTQQWSDIISSIKILLKPNYFK